MSFLARIREYNARKKDIVEPERKVPKLESQLRAKSSNYTFRRDEIKKFSMDGEELTENLLADEVMIPQASQYEVFADQDDVFDKDDNIEMPPKQKNVSLASNLCIFELGETFLNTPSESQSIVKKALSDATRSSLRFDYSKMSELMRIGSPETQMMCAGMAGLMLVLESEREKLGNVKKVTTETELITVTWDPSKVLSSEEQFIDSLDPKFVFNVKDVFSSFPPMKQTLRSVVQSLCNHWISKVLLPEDLSRFTTSTKPSKYSVIPIQFLNPPIHFINRVLVFEASDQESAKEAVSLIFRTHMTYKFTHARNVEKAAAMGQSSSSN